MRLALWLGAAVILAGGAVVLAVRLAPIGPAWRDADPLSAEAAATVPARNAFLVRPAGMAGGDMEAPVYALPPGELLDRLVAVALAEPRTTVLDGNVGEGRVVIVQRSRLMGYPDVVVVRAVPAEGGGSLALWSRSRFGGYDWGVNEARVRRWLDALASEALPGSATG